MKLNREAFLGLACAGREVASARSPHVGLRSLSLTATRDGILARACGPEASVQHLLPGDGKDGEVYACDSEEAANTLAALEGESVDVEAEGEARVRLRAGKRTASLDKVDVGALPALPDKVPTDGVALPGGELVAKALLDAVAQVDHKETKEGYRAVTLALQDDLLHVAATGGSALHLLRLAAPATRDPIALALTPDGARGLARFLGDVAEARLALAFDRAWVLAQDRRYEAATLARVPVPVAALVKAIPAEEALTRIHVDADALRDAVRFASLYASKTTKGLALAWGGLLGGLEVHAPDARGKTEVEGRSDGEGRIVLATDLLGRALDAVKGHPSVEVYLDPRGRKAARLVARGKVGERAWTLDEVVSPISEV